MSGFPKLGPEKRTLLQMKLARGNLLVSVRDDDDGADSSGWVMIHSVVKYSEHGAHAHRLYKKPPQVIDQRIDAEQGNPAHLLDRRRRADQRGGRGHGR
jgi:hypothetical protein